MLKIGPYRYDGKKEVRLDRISTRNTNGFGSKDDAVEQMRENIEKMMVLQDKLYAEDRHSILIILQAMDAAGKDGAIKHVTQGLNPQGMEVYSFKVPSSEELDHDYLWRVHSRIPERGRIGIFNRSYYEDVLVVRVHDLIPNLKLPKSCIGPNIWENRFRQIRDFERHLTENGVTILKFFLHVSKDEQKQRFLDRIDDPSKNWKFSAGDVKERAHWDEYQACYEEAIRETSTEYAPWHIIPADRKWFSRLLISEIIVKAMEKINPKYPKLNAEQQAQLAECRMMLMDEEAQPKE